MAQILPEDWHGHEGINEGERHTLGWLDANLGDDITVFAGFR